MRKKNFDLIVTICAVVINIAWTQFPNRPGLLGILLVLPLTFILPGYTLTEILFRVPSLYRAKDSSRQGILQAEPKPRQSVSVIDQLVLSLGLSMAINVLVGFGLNLSLVGLRASSWAITVGLLTTVFVLFTLFLRQKDNTRIASKIKVYMTLYQGVLLVLAGVVIMASIWLTVIRPLNPQPSYTLLWMLPAKNNSCSVTIGVQNVETTSITYRVEMTVNNMYVNSWTSVPLAPQQKWSQSVTVTPRKSDSLYIQTFLYRTDKPSVVYRNVHITLQVASITNNGQLQNQCSTRQ